MIHVSYKLPDPLPQPPVIFTLRNTEGCGTWSFAENEARQLHHALGMKLAELEYKRNEREIPQ